MAQGNVATETILIMVLRSKTSHTAVVVGILISMMLLSTAVPLGALAQENGEDEPNDVRMTATPIQGSQVNGNVEMQGGKDWFSVQSNGGAKVSFVLTKGPDSKGVSISIHSPGGKELANDSAYEGALRAEVETTAPKTGKYYLKVDGIVDKSSNIPYTVYTPAGKAPSPQQRKTPSATEESEPNDLDINVQDGFYDNFVPKNNSKVDEIPTDTKVNGEISSKNDYDWYSFYAKKGETVSIVLTKSSSTSLEFNHRIPGRSTFNTSYPAGGIAFTESIYLKYDDSRVQLSYNADKSGLHYINVSIYAAEKGGKYNIKVNTEQSSQSSTETDSGDSNTGDTTASKSSTSTDNTQQDNDDSGNKDTDTKQSKNNDKTSEESESEDIPIVMIGVGVALGGILVALIMGAVFLVYQQ